jgi:hypothetical protein
MKSLPETLVRTERPKLNCFSAILTTILAGIAGVYAQSGPFAPTNWPSTINATATVDYYIVDPGAVFDTPAGWLQTVSFAGGGDQAYESINLSGLMGDQSTSSFMNIADSGFSTWANVPVIDILLQVYGNDKLYHSDGSGINVIFREGALGTELPVSAGVVPPGANNGKWNWMLFSITNAIDPADGKRYVGDVPDPTKPGVQNGGVNGGTLRIEGVPGIIIRAVALGVQGAFGTSNQVNVFAAPVSCSPEPAVNLALIDINAGITNHLSVLNDTDQTVAYQANVGPAGDLRAAVQATATYMNFGILSNYLGAPCNFPRPMKVCVEFYDDPALAGATFGPEAYAIDDVGGTATYSGPLFTLTGSGQWTKVAFWLPAVDLAGVNTAPLTGGPRLTFNGGFPFIDRIELGVVRTGTNALAGLDPDPSYFMNPLICSTNYAYYAELDLQKGVTNGLNVGSSGGDQQMAVELAGPADDQRLSLRPDGGNNNLQFQILNQVFGPSYQDNADVAIAVTYYDDPKMAGATLRPQVYQSWIYGISTITFPAPPFDARVTLQGTGSWRDAYFELPNVNFNGVNQGPQSVVRYQTTAANSADPTTGYVHVSRVRYDAVRPCGPNEGINFFQTLQLTNAAGNPTVRWFGTGTLQSAPAAGGNWTNVMSLTNHVSNTYLPSAPQQSQFFRLRYPPLPSP